MTSRQASFGELVILYVGESAMLHYEENTYEAKFDSIQNNQTQNALLKFKSTRTSGKTVPMGSARFPSTAVPYVWEIASPISFLVFDTASPFSLHWILGVFINNGHRSPEGDDISALGHGYRIKINQSTSFNVGVSGTFNLDSVNNNPSQTANMHFYLGNKVNSGIYSTSTRPDGGHRNVQMLENYACFILDADSQANPNWAEVAFIKMF